MTAKWLLFSLLLIFPFVADAQKKVDLKRKYYGKYAGVIPAYKMDTGNEIIEVGSSPIRVIIGEDAVSMDIGNRSISGTYEVLFRTNKYYLLDAKMTGQLASERIVVYRRGGKISRDGLFPQPVTKLKKTR